MGRPIHRIYPEEIMWCAGCGKKLEGIQCCKDKGYWSLLSPLPADAWALEGKVYRKEIKRFLYLYRFPK